MEYKKLLWKDKFINSALQSPYAEILLHFKKSGIPLNELLRESHRKYLFSNYASEYVFGITLNNRSIALRLFAESTGSQGATFIIYLHELAHFLRIASCTTIHETFQRKNHEERKMKEDIIWKKCYLARSSMRLLMKQEILFCARIYKKTSTCIEKILEKIFFTARSSNVELFQLIFKANNKHYPGVNSISLCRMGGAIYLGECGSFYGSIKWKLI